MKKSSRPRREQPNMNLSEAEPRDESFSLEDIMNEFGGWSKRELEPETEPEQEAEPARTADLPDLQVSPVAPEEDPPTAVAEDPALEPAPEPAQQAQTGFVEKILPPGEESDVRIWTYQQPAQSPPPAAPRRAGKPRQEKVQKQAPARPRPTPPARPAPERTKPPRKSPVIDFPTVEAAYKTACKETQGITVRQRLMALWCLLAVAATVLNYLQLGALPFLNQGKTAAAILLGLLFLCAITAYDVLMRGVYHCLKLTVGLDSLLAVATVVFAVDGFVSIGAGKIPYTAVLSVGLFFAVWAEGLQNKAKRRALKAVLSMPGEPSAAVLESKAFQGNDCVFRGTASRERFVESLEAPDGASVPMRVYAAAVLVLSLVLSLVLHFLRDVNFLWSWSAMLAGSVPAAAFVVYWRPFASLCASLQRSGAALCGWQGAKSFSGRAFVCVEDTDLFSAASVSMNGMKVFGDYNVSQVVGYTYAVIAASGCGLEPTFREVFANQNGRSFLIDNFKRYEGGGVGAEIQGEVILVGSIGFMQLMGVKMPEGTNVRQAVYCAVNADLAAVFAIHYNPSSAVKSGLQTVLHSKGLSLLLATRDFILTPAFLRHKYKIPTGSMDYPGVEERARLSEPEKQLGGERAALFSRDSFLALAEAVAGGRGLCHSVRIGVGVSLFGGILGFVITLMLSFLGSHAVASAMNLMAFAALWTLPVLLLTAIAGK